MRRMTEHRHADRGDAASAPTVVVADDHAPTREEIVAALEEGGFDVVAAVGDAAAAVHATLQHRPDACLLDISMPGGGMRALAELHTRLPRCAIVMLTVSDEERHLLAALRAGAAGYLLKDMDPRRLPRALQAVLDGEVALPRALTGRVIAALRDRQAHRRSLVGDEPETRLTSREWQVLELLREGHDVHERNPSEEEARRRGAALVTCPGLELH